MVIAMGRNEQFNTRLPNDIARGVKQYAADKEVTKSETVRRAVEHFLDEKGYPREENQIMADGSGFIVRSTLRQTKQVFGALSLVLLAYLIFEVTIGVPLVDLSLIDALTLSVESALFATVTALLLESEVPEGIDRRLCDKFLPIKQRVRRLRG